MIEEYKQIKEFPNYEVSNFGNIKNIKKDKLMSLYPKNNGYIAVKLSKNGKSFECKVHRLVALEFVDNPNNLPFINHKDEIKSNNYSDNLEWCDSLYNNTYGTRCFRQSESMKVSIKQYSLDNVFIKEYSSIKEAGEYTNNNPDSISNCLSGRSKTSGGYIWRYS